MSRLLLLGSLSLVLGGCASLQGGPSLSPRAAEGVDPRLPVADRSGTLPADSSLAAQVAALRSRAVAAAGRAEPAIRAAASAAVGAGAPGSDSWINAQQLLSAAVAERAPFTQALADLDRLLAERIRSGGRLVPQDLMQAKAAAEELEVTDRRQAGELARLQRQLR